MIRNYTIRHLVVVAFFLGWVMNSPVTAQSIDFTPEYRALWISAGFQAKEAQHWASEGFLPEEAVPWRDSGFTPGDAAEWQDAGFTVETANEWRKSGFNAYEARNARQDGLTLKSASAWAASGLTDDRFVPWRRLGFSPNSAQEWESTGMNANEAQRWKRSGIPFHVASGWRNAGYSVETSKKCGSSGRSYDSVLRDFLALKVSPEDMKDYCRRGFKPDAVKIIRRHCPKGLHDEPIALYQANPFETENTCYSFTGSPYQILSRNKALFKSLFGKTIVFMDFSPKPVPSATFWNGIIAGKGVYEYTTTFGAHKIIPTVVPILAR